MMPGRRARGQSLVEMAMIAPVLILILLSVIDFGRAAYDYTTLSGAVHEGARVAVRTGATHPADGDVLSAVESYGIGLSLGAGPCVNGYLSGPLTAPSSPNTGYVYVVAGATGATVNAPGGQPSAPATLTCGAVTPAYAGRYPLAVTVKFNFQPLTPLAAQFFPSGIVMTVTSTMSTEY